MAQFFADGAVELYHNNSKKFETLSDGVKISGKTLSLINPSNFQDSTFTLEHGSSTVGNKHTIDFKDQNGSSTQIISYGSAFGSSKDNALEIKTSTTSNGDPTTRLTFLKMEKYSYLIMEKLLLVQVMIYKFITMVQMIELTLLEPI